MKIYQLDSPGGYQIVQPVAKEGMDFLCEQLNGKRRAETWSPPAVKILKEINGRPRLPADVMILGPASAFMVVKRPAMDKIGPLLLAFGEFLPLSNEEAEMWIFNPTNVINCLDESRSSITRFRSGGVMAITRYVFREEALNGAHVFKIPNFHVSPVYFTDYATNVIRNSGLILGVSFKELWSNEQTSFQEG